MDFWDVYARVYDELGHAHPYRELQELVVGMVPDHAGATVLDLGCGTGLTLARLAERGVPCKLVGIDASSAMLARARARVRHRADLKQHDANTPLPFPDATFNTIVCQNALYALRDPEAVLAEMRRVIKTGGMLVLANLHTPNRDAVLQSHYAHAQAHRPIPWVQEARLGVAFLALYALNGYIVRRAGNRSFHPTSPEKLAAQVTSAGFQVQSRRDDLYGGTAVLLHAIAE